LKPKLTACPFWASESNDFSNSNFSLAGEIVEAAGGNYSILAITGGVVAVHIEWICNLDFDFHNNCLPR
jgi:hypothetical protein